MMPAHIRSSMSVVAWIVCSSGLILYNKHLLAGWFPFPIILTMLHMIFASLVTWSLRFTGIVSTKLVPWATYRRLFIPIAILFTFSLILSNYAYMYLSVSFIQMMKASTPIVVLTISTVFGFERKVTPALVVVVVLVCFGVFLAAYGELLWSTFGVILQVAAILVEASRLVTIQVVLKEISLGPLDSLTLYAPACALMLFIASILTGELFKLTTLEVAYLLQLLGNVIVAFALNLVTLWLVMETSSLVLTMCGIVKDILLIFLSKLIFKSFFTPLQVVGYTISLASIYAFNQMRVARPPPAPLGGENESSFSSGLPPVRGFGYGISYILHPVESRFPFLFKIPGRHFLVGTFIFLFFISGMIMSDKDKREPDGPPYWEFVPVSPERFHSPPTSLLSCRTQPKVRISVDVLPSWTGGIEALLQLMLMVKEVTPLLSFPAMANSLLPLERVYGPYLKRYPHEFEISYHHVGVADLGKNPEIFEILLVPEGHDCHAYMAPNFPLLGPSNSQVFMWQLANHPINPSCHYFVHTDWFRSDFNMNLPATRLVRPYLSRDFYQPAIDVGFLQYNGSIDTTVAEKHKRNLILVDNDTPDEITEYLKSYFYGRATITVVSGFTVSELHIQYIQAKVVVDWCLVGAERVPIEASLFGAVFISSFCIGYPENDFPVGDEFFLETKEEMAAKIDYTLDHWTKVVHRQNKLRRNALLGKSIMRKDVFKFLESVTPPLCTPQKKEKYVPISTVELW